MSIFPTKLLLATDSSKEADMAAETALDLARKTGSELNVVHVLAWSSDRALDPEGLDPAVREEVQSRASARLEELVGKIEASGGAVVGSHLSVGRPDAEIVEQAEEMGAGLIVMGSRGFGTMRRTLTGSVSDSVVRHAHCSVMVVRGEPVSFPTKIVLATDGSKEANLASSAATELAKGTNSELHVVCVAHTPTMFYESSGTIVDPGLQSRMEKDAEEAAKSALEEQVQRIREAGIEVAGAHTEDGFPEDEIAGLAGRLSAGLIVVGNRGRALEACPYGQRLGLGGSPRPLPGYGSAFRAGTYPSTLKGLARPRNPPEGPSIEPWSLQTISPREAGRRSGLA